MSNRVDDPGSRGGNTTADVAAILSAIVLPSIERFTSDSPLLAGLPPYTPCPAPTPEPLSRALVARSVYDDAVAALSALKRLEDATAACGASLIDRLMNAAAVEGTALSLDPWQSDMAEVSARVEIATVLCIPEGTAAILAHHSTELLESHPAALDALSAGALSWRHAGIIVDETSTLAQTPGMSAEDLRSFEQRLLKAALHTTPSAFKSKARRLRESTHPESLPVRTKEAFLKRDIRMEPGRDGMSWLTLHLPAPAAEGIWVHCTREARKLQGPSENRTLMQLRADIAAALLLGQQLPRNAESELAAEAGIGAESDTGFGGCHTLWAADGYVDGLVDGVAEDPLREYLDQLDAVRDGMAVADPPMPQAQILVTVPALGLLGNTNQPANLVGYGPIPETVARKLLASSDTFLRILTDPVSGEPLDTAPERYWIRESERAVLRATAGSCYFPNCTNPVLDTETDHLTPWEYGGASTSENQRPACKRHHLLKHFKDDKDKHGRYRTDRDPDRAGIRLRGWTPVSTRDGGVGWRSPSGKYHPPLPREIPPSAYPAWLKRHIDKTLNNAAATDLRDTTADDAPTGPATPANGVKASIFEQILVEYESPHAA
ncbi:hypothetical protein AL755_20765 [Arthrobacter sp. ERGS1:01]|uniref:HNH endonuclease signature motif containing protein n=1 Tax=Arthrobacter sp. ERGS1:01 TaxID=1704044 RepID=UPI0006B5E044|nr:HNH endonuclease signature motif containing protein [Arthrobacter sp. ERGS1:01]ALE07348.1 hypothetical protein AL755_20765 [Arthrobacter sp. ERGS1:01]